MPYGGAALIVLDVGYLKRWCIGYRRALPRPTAPSQRSLVLQSNDIAGGSASKQRPDQLRGDGLVALLTLIAL
jgi:hypothetical protein